MKHPSQSPLVGDGTLGVYVHWPFCEAKCPYCDFNSHVSRSIDHQRWKAAYLAEIRRARETIGPRRVETVFFGGGTPSLMPSDTVAAILDAISFHWTISANAEITLEANPGSSERSRFEAFRTAGVNRLSIGVQSLRDEDLRRLGRLHSAEDARHAVSLAASLFPRASIDLIYARQWQSPTDWEAELGDALSLPCEHISLYQLTIEEGTRFAALDAAGKLRGLPEEELSATLYELTQDRCTQAGRPAYEVSNHARPGEECRHNLRYWGCLDVLGIGPGAHGRITSESLRFADVSPRAPGQWLSEVEARGTAIKREPQEPEEMADEYLVMGLRTTAGISLSILNELRASPVQAAVIEELSGLGYLTSTNGLIRATPSGRLVLNELIRRLGT